MSDDGFELDTGGIRQLSPQQWSALRRDIVSRARDERSRLLRQMIASLLATAGTVWRVAGKSHDAVRSATRRHLARQQRLRELRELSAMDDIGLRDIGISRLEVRAALQSNTGPVRQNR